jgi:hypothetical protein
MGTLRQASKESHRLSCGTNNATNYSQFNNHNQFTMNQKRLSKGFEVEISTSDNTKKVRFESFGLSSVEYRDLEKRVLRFSGIEPKNKHQ